MTDTNVAAVRQHLAEMKSSELIRLYAGSVSNCPPWQLENQPLLVLLSDAGISPTRFNGMMADEIDRRMPLSGATWYRHETS